VVRFTSDNGQRAVVLDRQPCEASDNARSVCTQKALRWLAQLVCHSGALRSHPKHHVREKNEGNRDRKGLSRLGRQLGALRLCGFHDLHHARRRPNSEPQVARGLAEDTRRSQSFRDAAHISDWADVRFGSKAEILTASTKLPT
jgi:hypothetical protein